MYTHIILLIHVYVRLSVFSLYYAYVYLRFPPGRPGHPTRVPPERVFPPRSGEANYLSVSLSFYLSYIYIYTYVCIYIYIYIYVCIGLPASLDRFARDSPEREVRKTTYPGPVGPSPVPPPLSPLPLSALWVLALLLLPFPLLPLSALWVVALLLLPFPLLPLSRSHLCARRQSDPALRSAVAADVGGRPPMYVRTYIYIYIYTCIHTLFY